MVDSIYFICKMWIFRLLDWFWPFCQINLTSNHETAQRNKYTETGRGVTWNVMKENQKKRGDQPGPVDCFLID